MININDQDKVKKLIQIASGTKQVAPNVDKRILALIEQKTVRTEPKRRIFPFLKYNPRLVFSLCALLAVCLGVSGFFLFRAETVYQPAFTVISQHQGRLLNTDMPLEAGYALREHDLIATAENEQVTFQRPDVMAMQLFGGSRLEISHYTPTDPVMKIALHAGALYINKETHFPKQASFRIDVRNYEFVLTGTRLYVQVDADNTITAACYQGDIEVLVQAKEAWRRICMLHANQKIIIREGGEWQIIPENKWTDREKFFDREIRKVIPFGRHFNEPLERALPQGTLGEKEENTETPEEQSRAAAALTKADYTISSLGRLSAAPLGGAKVNFFASTQVGSTAYIVNGHEAYLLAADTISRIKLPGGDYFIKIQPVATGKSVCIFSTKALYLVARGSLQVTHNIPIGEIGFLGDNYGAVLSGETLYIPFQNSGYYSLQPDTENPVPKKIFDEPFPVSPVVTAGGLLVGSYYSNYLAAIDFNGNVRWKYSLPGKSYSNIRQTAHAVYAYVRQPKGPTLIKLNENGAKLHEWRLPAELTSDFIIDGTRLFAVDKQGELFVFNTATSGHRNIAQVYSRRLSTGEQRMTGFLIHNGRLYIGDDKGKIIVYNIKQEAVEDSITVAAGRAFYAKPFIISGNLYCISNRGILYKIVKSDR